MADIVLTNAWTIFRGYISVALLLMPPLLLLASEFVASDATEVRAWPAKHRYAVIALSAACAAIIWPYMLGRKVARLVASLIR